MEDDDDDDDDAAEDECEYVGLSGHPQQQSAEALDSLKNYMDQMDQELRGTNIGQSFIPSEKVGIPLA